MILCSGCSFTNNQEKLSMQEQWPYYLAEMFNASNLNVGWSGVSNDYIANITIRNILTNHKEIEAVFVAWSEWHRIGVFGSKRTYNPSVVYWKNSNKLTDDNIIWKVDTTTEEKLIENNKNIITAESIIMHNLIMMHAVEKVCEEYNISYVFAQGCNPIADNQDFMQEWDLDFSKILDALGNYETIIDTSKFYQYPGIWQLGGKTISQGVPLIDPPNDHHPNPQGHQVIAKRFYEFYSSLY